MSLRTVPAWLVLTLVLVGGCPEDLPFGDDEPIDVINDDDATEPPLECDDGWIAIGRACIWDWSDDWSALTEGVGSVDSGGMLPSSFVVHGPSAFPVILDEENRAFVVAARHGEGRVVALGHEGYLGGALDGDGDGVGRLVHNAVGWVGGQDGVVGLTASFGALRDALLADGFDATTVTVDDLQGVDVLVVESWNSYSDDQLAGIGAFVEAGGGLLAGGHAWYWAYDGGDSATGYSGSRMLNDAGLTWTPYGHVTAGADAVSAEPPSILLHARAAIEAFIEHTDGAIVYELADQLLGAASAGLALDVLPLAGFPDYFERARLLADTVGPVEVTEDDPLDRSQQPIEEVVIWIDLKYARELPADQVWTHEGFTSFPGDVPDDAPTVARTLEMDGEYLAFNPKFIYSGSQTDAFRGTGIYAPPAALLTVTIPADLAGQGISVTIGAHTDGLQGAEQWKRYPVVSRTWPLDQPTTEIASAFGGLVYLRLPYQADYGPIEVTIDGGVAAPWYRHGSTTNDEWLSELRDAPAPWGELDAPLRFGVTVPSEHLRDLDDPEALMDFWVAVQDTNVTLLGYEPEDRPRMERFVVDRQISAGWMHSGYPIMAHLASAAEVLDLASLNTVGAWGPFHELGHNHQWSDWVLPGTTETTCNLFSVLASEEVAGVDRADAHEALQPAARQQRLDDYLAGGADFWGQWSVWTALETYLQLQEAFGWTAHATTFAAYRDLDEADLPGDDQEKIDLWAVLFAQSVDRDLGPFFVAWGLPLSGWAIDDMATRPSWDEDPMAGL